jgi:hypothetical protein
MGKKLLVSLAMEGKFSSEGLQAVNEEDDILMAMSRELVTEKGIGESADSIWAKLQKQQEEVFAVKSSPIDEAIPEPVQEADLVSTGSSVPPADEWLSFGTPLESTRRKSSRRECPLEGQLTLF